MAETDSPGHWSWDIAERLDLDLIEEFLTGRVADRPVDRVLATVLYTDIVASTELALRLGDQQWRQLLDAHDKIARRELRRFRGREINTTGDGFVATFDGPARAVHCVQGIIHEVRALGIDVRAGLHTGECAVRGRDLAGITMHIGVRVADLAAPGEVLTSRVVRDLVTGSGIQFESRGQYTLKGIPQPTELYAATATSDHTSNAA